MLRHEEFIPYHEGMSVQHGSGLASITGLLSTIAPVVNAAQGIAQNTLVKELGTEVGKELVGYGVRKALDKMSHSTKSQSKPAENVVRPVLKKQKRDRWTTSPILTLHKKHHAQEGEEDSMDSS